MTQLILKESYGGQIPSLDNWKETMAVSFSDTYFAAIGTHTSRIMASKSEQPVYVYEYTFQGSFSLLDLFFAGTAKLLARVRRND